MRLRYPIIRELMSIRVEFYGIARSRAEVPETTVDARRLGELLRELECRFPGLAPGCISDGQLAKGFVANVNGQRFTADTNTPLTDGDCVLILSADAGG